MVSMVSSGAVRLAARNSINSPEGLPLRLYFAFAVFLMTLQSFHIGGGAFVCYFGLILLFPLVKSRVDNGTLFTVISLAAGIFLFSITSSSDGSKSLYGQLFSLLAMLVVPSVFYSRPRSALWALNSAIFLQASAVSIQVAMFALTQEYLDFLSMFGAAEQVVISKKGLEISGLRVPRFSGLSNEPGTHATLMSAMLAVSYCGARRWTWLHSLGSASVLATLSLGGIALMIPLVLIAAFDRVFIQKRSIAVTVLIAGLAASVLAQWFLSNYGHRVDITRETLDHDLMLIWIFQDGPFTLFGSDHRLIPYYFTFGYLGSGLDIFLLNGVWGSLVVGAFVTSLGPLNFAVCIVILLAKLKITYPLIYSLFGFIVVFHSASARADSEARFARGRP